MKISMKHLANTILTKIENAYDQWRDGQITNSELHYLISLAYKEYETIYERNIKED